MGYLDQTQLAYYSGDTHGGYQNLSLSDIINNFTATYVGEGKILGGVLKADISFHAHRALAELHYDTLRSCKSQEITLPPSLTMVLPQDYVNYTKLTWSDGNGIEHVLYPASKTSNPRKTAQDDDGNYIFDVPLPGQDALLYQFPLEVVVEDMAPNEDTFVIYTGLGGAGFGLATSEEANEKNPLEVGMEIISPWFPIGTTISAVSSSPTTTGVSDFTFTTSNSTFSAGSGVTVPTVTGAKIKIGAKSETWEAYDSSSNNQVAIDQSTTTNLAVDADNYFQNTGERYGLDPQYAQANGSFFIDCNSGKIHFSSNLSGKTIILHYLSDGLGTDEEMLVPKLAEEAIYKWILYGCLLARVGVPAGMLQLAKREKFTETRKAKIRLSNIKIEEITQIIRGKSKWIKH